MPRYFRKFKRYFDRLTAHWKDLALPGVLMIGLVCGLRATGHLQMQELMALDALSRNCDSPSFIQSSQQPLTSQARSQQVVILSMDDIDYQLMGGFPVSDRVLAEALSKLQQYQPRVIGIDIFRDLPIGEGRAELLETLKSIPSVVTVAVVLNQDDSLNVAPPSGMSSEEIGFADVIVDQDGKLRRVILAAKDWDGNLNYSLPLQLAKQYLKAENIAFSHGDRSSDPIQLGTARLQSLQPNVGGYVNADTNGNQMLMNFCQFQQPQPTIAMRDLLGLNPQTALSEEDLSEILRDRVVIIGTIANSVKDSFITAAARETLYSQRTIGSSAPNQLIYGVEIHANATQQIINAALNRSHILKTWPDAVEYCWIVVWGLIGIAVSVTIQSPWKSILSLIAVVLGLVSLSYVALFLHWWIPLLPAASALAGAGLVAAFFDRDIRTELAQRKLAVERTYDAVHNGPLQHLAAILRSLNELEIGSNTPGTSSQALSTEQLRQQLQTLNIEMRGIFEHMRQEATEQSQRLYLTDSTSLDLQQPLPYLLYQVYEHTLSQPLSGFSTVQNFISPNFECLMNEHFRTEQKRGICLFLQEALMNVGKHAMQATCIDVVCEADTAHYQLQIIDNGESSTAPVRVREGTRQAIALAQSLKGKFQRYPKQPQGTVCELVWPKP